MNFPSPLLIKASIIVITPKARHLISSLSHPLPPLFGFWASRFIGIDGELKPQKLPLGLVQFGNALVHWFGSMQLVEMAWPLHGNPSTFIIMMSKICVIFLKYVD